MAHREEEAQREAQEQAAREGQYLEGSVANGTRCPYCHRPTVFVDSSEVYGRSYGMIYLCRPCRAYVGVHKGTTKALGRLANAELREWKKRAHAALDPVWRQGHLSRGDAYAWLAKRMDLHIQDCHIGMFDVKQCQHAVGLLEEWEGVTTEL